MSKQDEFMKVQTCVLSVNIHCDGCKQKVGKILKKFEGVYSSSINAEQGRVTVSGCFDPQKLIKKLEKSGKHAELLGSQKGSSNNQGRFNDQFKNMQVSDGSKGHNNKAQKGFGKEQPKGGHQHQQVMQQQVMKNNNNNKEQKSVKFSKADPEEFDMSDDYDDDEDFYDDDDEDDFSDEDEEFSHGHKLPNNKGGVMPNNKMMQGNGFGPYAGKMGPMGMASGNGPTKGMIDDKKSGGNGFKKGGGGVIDFPLEGKGKDNSGGGGKEKKAEWKNSPKKKSGNNGEKTKKKSGGGLRALLGFGNKKSGKVGGSVPKKPTSNNNGNGNGKGKKGGSDKKNSTTTPKGNKSEFELDFTTGKSKEGKSGGKGEKMGGNNNNMGPGPSPMGNGMQFGQMGPGPMGNYPMGGQAAVRGLPAQPMMSGGGGYYQGMGQIPGYGGAPGNPYAQQQQQQQQYMAMMMSQQRGGNGNDMFQPMMYSRPYPAVNYAPPMGMAHPANDNLTHFFSDENTESCNIM